MVCYAALYTPKARSESRQSSSMSDPQQETNNRFVFAIGDPSPFPYEPYVVDELGELELLKRAMWQFCQDHNHWVSVVVGTIERRIEFDPDIEMIYEELPTVLRCLAGGVPVRLMFAEEGFDLIFASPGIGAGNVYRAEALSFDHSLEEGKIPLTPQADDAPIIVTLSEWGYSNKKAYAVLPLRQVIATLRAFLDEFLQIAVEVGAMSEEERQAFLG